MGEGTPMPRCFFETGFLSCTRRLKIMLGRLARELQGSIYLSLPSAGVKRCSIMSDILCVCLGLNLHPHACVTGTLPTEPSPSPLIITSRQPIRWKRQLIKCGKLCPVCCDHIRCKIMEDYGGMFTALTTGESGRWAVAFSAIPATFDDTGMKTKGRRAIADDRGFAGSVYLSVLSCFAHLLTWYL